MIDSLEVQVPFTSRWGEVIAKRKGVIARWGLKEAWSKDASRGPRRQVFVAGVESRWTRTGYEAYGTGRAGNRSRSPQPSKGAGGKFGGCALRAVIFITGGLLRVPETGPREERFSLTVQQKSARRFAPVRELAFGVVRPAGRLPPKILAGLRAPEGTELDAQSL